MKRKIISIKELKKICDEYDNANGVFPESRFEGCAVYNFICEKISKGYKRVR